MNPDNLKWKFRERDPDAENREDASQEVFDKIDVDKFIRESIQNSNDAIRDHQSLGGEIEIDIETLSGEELERFKENIGWGDLEDHIDALHDSSTVGRRARNFLEVLENKDEMRNVIIHDRHAAGLTGPERADPGENSRFADLIRNVSWTTKDDPSSGGSHGIGKAVNWAFSGISTIFVNSNPEDAEFENRPRLIGRSKLATHKLDEGVRKDSGYYGEEKGEEGDEWVSSIRGDLAEDKASEIMLERDREIDGTSILIPGFHNPTNESFQDQEELVDEMREAVVRNFWPVIHDKELDVKILDSPVDLQSPKTSTFHPFIECYRKFNEGDLDESLENEGDVVKKEIPVRLAESRDEDTPDEAQVTLLVRRSGKGSDESLEGRIARMRGAKMIVDYKNYRSMKGTVPFHAVLLAGEARGDSPSDKALEKFLRISEPVEHDKWLATRELKNSYYTGQEAEISYTDTLEDLKNNVKQELRRIVSKEIGDGESGPDKFNQRIPMGGKSLGGTKRGSTKIKFHDIKGSYDGERSKVSGKILRDTEEENKWEADIEAYEKGELGTGKQVPISDLEIIEGNAKKSIKSGKAKIEASQDCDSILFELETVKIPKIEIELDLDTEILEDE